MMTSHIEYLVPIYNVHKFLLGPFHTDANYSRELFARIIRAHITLMQVIR